MIDKSKRATLRKLAVGTGVVAAGASLGSAIASDHQLLDEVRASNSSGSIEVTTRVSAINNDIEVVLSNTGERELNISHIEPKTVRVARGEFDFASLLQNGTIKLDAGQSVSVPLQRRSMQLHTPMPMAMPTLSKALQQSMSVITDDNAYALVTVKTAVAVV